MRCVALVAVLLWGGLLARAEGVPGCPAKNPESAESAAQQAAAGVAAYSRREMPTAIASLNRALATDPCNALAHLYAWRIQALAGKTVEARQQLALAHGLATEPRFERVWEAVEGARVLEESAGAPRLTVVVPAAGQFFAKTLDCHGIPVRSSAVVDADALYLACDKVLTMLRDIPAARSRLIAKGAELHVIGEFQVTTDLPENARFRGTVYVDAEGRKTDMAVRTRGVGGLMSSCGEENLLHLSSDKYGDGSDTCTHEFSHDVMENGLSDGERSTIERQYRSAVKAGLWESAYAAVNAKEYWAELSMWYFGTHGNYVRGANGERLPAGPGAEALRAYDPEGFGLLDRLYRRR